MRIISSETLSKILSVLLLGYGIYSMCGVGLGVYYMDSVSKAWSRFIGDGVVILYFEDAAFLGIPVQEMSWIFSFIIGVILMVVGYRLWRNPKLICYLLRTDAAQS